MEVDDLDPPGSDPNAEKKPRDRTSWRNDNGQRILDAGLRRSNTERAEMEQCPHETPKKLSTKLRTSKVLKLQNVVNEAINPTHDPYAKESKYMISPNSPFLQNWDCIVIMALIFTALVTPYEVALLDTHLNPLFVVNRLIDTTFVIDMALQLMVVQEVQTPEGTELIRTRSGLAKRYLRTWFCIDFVSILPMDLIGFFQWLWRDL